MVILEGIRHAVDWQVFAIGFPTGVLNSFEDLFSLFRLEPVVVLRSDVHDEPDVAGLCRLGNGGDGVHQDLPLNLILLEIVESFVGQKHGSALSHTPSVVLEDLTGEDNLLSSIELVGDCRSGGATLLIIEGFCDIV